LLITDPLHKATVANWGCRPWYAADAISWRSTLLKETEGNRLGFGSEGDFVRPG
jgi:hypothetical protein